MTRFFDFIMNPAVLFALIIAAMLSFSPNARGDDTVPPSILADLSKEKVIFHGLPGDDGFFEEHIPEHGRPYFVDSEGHKFPSQDSMMAHLEVK